ncbi:hypothetical protein RV134_320248 [Roseovarius sp. EC-HK134]|nr:hypothetical protein RV134_320248 [Roseovarius sp. EC-HK134]
MLKRYSLSRAPVKQRRTLHAMLTSRANGMLAFYQVPV